jgi:hypothetical protein
MARAKKIEDSSLDKDCKIFIASMAKANVITPQGVSIMESTLPLLKYKYKHDNKKPLEDWYAEIIMLSIGAFVNYSGLEALSVYGCLG